MVGLRVDEPTPRTHGSLRIDYGGYVEWWSILNGQVADVLEVWALVAVNFLGFFLGAIITTLSYYAYRTNETKTSLRNVTVGFALLTLGIAIEPLYQLGIEGTHVLASNQNITLQLIEGTVISLGLLVLFFSIYNYSSRSQRQRITIDGVDDDLFEDTE